MPLIVISPTSGGGVSSTFFLDAMNESAGTIALTSHVPDTGASWAQHTRHTYSGTLNVVDDVGYASPSADGADQSVLAVGDVVSGSYPSASYAVEVIANGPNDTSDDVAGIITHFVDTSNFYFMWLVRSAASPDIGISSVVANAETVLGSTNSNLTLTADRTYLLEARVSGGQVELKAYIDGTLYVTATDSSLLAAGKGGFGFGRLGASALQDVDSRWKVLNVKMYRL